MLRLVKAEIKKVWQSRVFGIALAVLLCANLFLLWVVTNPLSGAYSSHAYKTMQASLQGLSMEEKQAFVNEEMRRVTGFAAIDNILRSQAYGSVSGDYYRQQYKAEFDEFYDEYTLGNFLKYNSTLAREYLFLQKIQAECKVVAEYDTFLNEINKKAAQMSGISIFAQSADGYSLKNIEKTAEAYENLHGIKIDYFPQMGIYTALDFELSDLILIFAMLLIATALVRTERDNGLINLVRCAPGGRLKTAAAKLMALCLSLGAVLVLLYGVNLIYCSFVYGIGDLSRSIQSVPALMRSTLPLSVLQYLGVFLFTKWLSAIVLGIFVMLCMLFAKRAFAGYIGALGFLGLNLFMCSIIPATSNLNVLKYANLISLLRTNELIGGYRNLYFFAQPVSIWLVEGITAAICLAAFIFLFCFVFCRAQLLNAGHISIKLPQIFKAKATATTIARQEAKKLLLMNGAALFLAVFLGYQLYGIFTAETYISADEIYYQSYIKQVEGEITEEKLDKLRELYLEFEPIISIQNAYNRKEINSEVMNLMMSEHYGLQQKMNAFNRVWFSQSYLNTQPRAQFVYESGWLNLFDMNTGGTHDRLDSLLAALLCAICFGGLFAMEKQSGMERIIAATPLGRIATVKAKLRCVNCVCVLITVFSCLPRLAITLKDYGIGALLAPSYSMAQFSTMWELPLIFYLMLFALARYLAIRTMAGVTLALSYKTGNLFSAVFISSSIFALPIMLSMSGLESAKWLSVYPMFHVCALFAKQNEAVAAMLIMFIFAFIIWRCSDYLKDNFGVKTSQTRC